MLLRGVNDDPMVMKELMQKLLKARVRPYYIYMADQVAGGEHFRTTVEKGLEIVKALRGWTSGLAVPHFVIDAPGGGGKVPLLPEYVEEINEDEVIFRNYEGQRFIYKQPRQPAIAVPGLRRRGGGRVGHRADPSRQEAAVAHRELEEDRRQEAKRQAPEAGRGKRERERHTSFELVCRSCFPLSASRFPRTANPSAVSFDIVVHEQLTRGITVRPRAGAGLAADRSDAAFSTLYDRHTPRALQTAWRVLGGNTDEAEDAVQEAWARAISSLDTWNQTESVQRVAPRDRGPCRHRSAATRAAAHVHE